ERDASGAAATLQAAHDAMVARARPARLAGRDHHGGTEARRVSYSPCLRVSVVISSPSAELTLCGLVRTYSSSIARRGGNAAHVAGSPSSRASGRGGRDEIDQGLGGGCPDGLRHAGSTGLRGDVERRRQRRRFGGGAGRRAGDDTRREQWRRG